MLSSLLHTSVPSFYNLSTQTVKLSVTFFTDHSSDPQRAVRIRHSLPILENSHLTTRLTCRLSEVHKAEHGCKWAALLTQLSVWTALLKNSCHKYWRCLTLLSQDHTIWLTIKMSSWKICRRHCTCPSSAVQFAAMFLQANKNN